MRSYLSGFLDRRGNLVEAKADGNQGPNGYRLLAPPGGLEAPAPDRFQRGLIELLMTGRASNEHFGNGAVGKNVDLELGDPLHALPSGRFRIARKGLISPLWLRKA